MRMFTIVLLGIIALLMAICYCVMVVAYEAEERAKRMERAWKEVRDE